MAGIQAEETSMKLKMPKFKNESEEADWWYANRKAVARELRNAKQVVDANGKPMSPAEIVAAHVAKQNQTQAISIRLSTADIERAKRRAEAKGIGYQTLIRMLLHEALDKAS